MKLFVVLLLSLIVCSTATAATTFKKLDEVATVFAMRPTEALCATGKEDEDLQWALGYTYVGAFDGTANGWFMIRLNLCKAALSISQGKTNQYKDSIIALAVLVLVHESYHVRLWTLRSSEAAVECRAIRHWKYAMMMLGATEEYAEKLKGWAIAWHYRVGYKFPEYKTPDCKIPEPKL